LTRLSPPSTPSPYTTLFRSDPSPWSDRFENYWAPRPLTLTPVLKSAATMTSVSSSPKTRRRMTMSPKHTAGNESWRPERETKAQRQWQPGQKKQRRSTKVLFDSTVLLGEDFVIAFFGLLLFGLI